MEAASDLVVGKCGVSALVIGGCVRLGKDQAQFKNDLSHPCPPLLSACETTRPADVILVPWRAQSNSPLDRVAWAATRQGIKLPFRKVQ